MDHHHLQINCGQCCVNVPDVLLPEHLLSKELTRKIPFHPHIPVYNHCTCVEFFVSNICVHALVSGIWYKIALMGHKLLVIDKILISGSGLPFI